MILLQESSLIDKKPHSKVKVAWMYFYSAVDKDGNTINLLFTKRGNKYAPHQFLVKAIHQNGCPKVINTLIKVKLIKKQSKRIKKGVSSE